MYLDADIGPCASCATERRRYVKLGSTMALCLPCTQAAARGANGELMPEADRKKHEAQRATYRNRMRERRVRLIAAGVCIDCGREEALATSQRGARCNARHLSRQARPVGARASRVTRWS
jgi:hypothetical protein